MKRILVETAWRLAVALLAAAVSAGELPLQRLTFFNWFAILRRPSLLAPTAIVAAFWIIGGAIVRAVAFRRPFWMLLFVRIISFLATSAAVLISVRMVTQIARAGWPLHVAMSIVSLFSLALYACWRWISLLLTLVEERNGWRDGWHTFVLTGPQLALAAATNSTIKWFFFALAAFPALLLLRFAMWAGLLLSGLAAIAVSGYFAARLRDTIHELL